MHDWLDLLTVGVCLLAAYVALRVMRLTGARAAWTFVASAAGVIAVSRLLDMVSTDYEWLRWARDPRLLRTSDLATAALLCLGGLFMREHFLRARRDERALRESEARYQSLFENTALGVFRSTPDGRITLANPALVRILGCASEEELYGLDLEVRALETYYDRARFREAIERDGVVVGMETAWTRRDGTVVRFRENARAVRDESGRTVAYEGTLEDVTDRRRLEEQLVQAQKMEAVGRLAGGIAHDFNNLLTAIIGYAQLLLARLASDDPGRSDAEQVVWAGDRAAVLTRQLLAFSRKELHQSKPVDLNAVATETAPMLRRLVGEDVRIETKFADEPATVVGDPGQIEQVLMNLVVNARDAMPRGGRIAISTAIVPLPPCVLSCGDDVRAGRYVALTVRDTGSGMGSDTMAHMFEPFFTKKPAGQGTGLGLAMVYGIAHQSDGHVDVKSWRSRGTRFTVYLPVSAVAAAQATGDGERPQLPFARDGETILVAEDDPGVLALTKVILTGLGYRVVAAESGPAALREAQRNLGRIDLLVADLVMPEMDGGELYETLRIARPDTGIVFMSGYAEDALQRRSIGTGEAEFLHKPFTAIELATAVRAALDAQATAQVS